MVPPRVTLGIPIYNVEPFLAETILSVQAQTFSDFRVIAALDGCTDRSEEILRDLSDKRYTILKNAENMGVCTTRNMILEHADTPLLAWMDADDTITPDRLEAQLGFMEDHPEIDILGAYYDEVDQTGKQIKPPFPFPTSHEDIMYAFRSYGALCNGVAIYRTDRVKATGGYEFTYAEDYALYLKCLAFGLRFANLPRVLLHYRQRSGQIMSRLREPTLRSIDRAYFKYGPLIWGDSAPDYISGPTPMHRLRRRFLRLFHDWRQDD